MAWRWVSEPPPADQGGSERTFATQGEAESWLGEFYPELLAGGVAQVTLYEEGRLVYGPMGLQPEGQ